MPFISTCVPHRASFRSPCPRLFLPTRPLPSIQVKSRAHFDLYKLRPVDAAKTCFVPALFAAGTEDVLVRPHHSKMIFDAFAGDKNVVTFDGDHNDMRPDFFMDSVGLPVLFVACICICACFCVAPVATACARHVYSHVLRSVSMQKACIFLKNILLLHDGLDVPLDGHGRPLSIRHAFMHSQRSAVVRPPRALDDEFQEQLTLIQAEEAMLREAIMASMAIATPSTVPHGLPTPPASTAGQPPLSHPSPSRLPQQAVSGGVTAALGIDGALAGSTRGPANP